MKKLFILSFTLCLSLMLISGCGGETTPSANDEPKAKILGEITYSVPSEWESKEDTEKALISYYPYDTNAEGILTASSSSLVPGSDPANADDIKFELDFFALAMTSGDIEEIEREYLTVGDQQGIHLIYNSDINGASYQTEWYAFTHLDTMYRFSLMAPAPLSTENTDLLTQVIDSIVITETE